MKSYKRLFNEFNKDNRLLRLNTSKVFKLDKKGNSVVNKRTKAYRECLKEVERLRDGNNINKTKYSQTSIKTIITTYNKELRYRDLGIIAKVIRYIFNNDYIEINETYKDNLTSRTTNVLVISDGQEIINRGVEFLSLYDWKKLAIGLSILTGRRISEVLYSAKFEYVNDNHVRFTGQLKQKFKRGYVIQTLGNAKLICDALDKLRILKTFKSVKDVNYLASTKLSKEVKTLLGKERKIHDLRGFYAYVTYHLTKEGKSSNMSFDGFTMANLGHLSIKSGESYRTYRVEM